MLITKATPLSFGWLIVILFSLWEDSPNDSQVETLQKKIGLDEPDTHTETADVVLVAIYGRSCRCTYCDRFYNAVAPTVILR